MFYPVETIAEAIRAEVEKTALFRKTVYVAVTNAGQLQEILETQTSAPAAIVCIGAIQPSDQNLDRTIRPLVVIMDMYRKGEQARAASVWRMAEAVADRFSVKYDGVNPPQIPLVGGLEWAVGQMLPLDSKRHLSAVSLELSGVEVCKIDQL